MSKVAQDGTYSAPGFLLYSRAHDVAEQERMHPTACSVLRYPTHVDTPLQKDFRFEKLASSAMQTPGSAVDSCKPGKAHDAKLQAHHQAPENGVPAV